MYNDVNKNIGNSHVKTVTEEPQDENDYEEIDKPVEEKVETSSTKFKLKLIGFALIGIGAVIAGAFASVNETVAKIGLVPLIAGIVMVIIGFKKNKNTK